MIQRLKERLVHGLKAVAIEKKSALVLERVRPWQLKVRNILIKSSYAKGTYRI
jgi:hypothetical protein